MKILSEGKTGEIVSEIFIENLKEIVSQYAYPNFLTDLQIVKSNFGSYSGCFGAMMYILNS